MAKKEAKKSVTIYDFLQKMTIERFIETFCSIYDYETGEEEPVIPWPRQRELCKLIDSTRKLFWPKARQVGGSLIAGFLAVKVAISEPNSDIYIISKTEDDAKYFLKDKVKAALDALPKVEGIDWGKWQAWLDRIEFSNGSTITSITTSEDAGRGRSAVRLIIMDEAGAIEHARQIWKSASPAIEKHPRGQMVVISNSKNGSWFNMMLKKIDEGKTIGIDFTFQSKEGGPHVNAFDPDWGLRLVFLYDHGFEHYAVFTIALYDPYKDHIYILDELFMYQKDISEISGEILEKIEYWEGMDMPRMAWKKIADSAIFAKHGQKQISELLKLYTGIQFTKSYKWNEQASTDMLRTRFTQNRITIHPRCQMSIGQTRDLLYDKNGKPMDKNNDFTDLARYLCSELKQETPPPKPKKRKAYERRASYGANEYLHGSNSSDEINMGEAHDWQKY